MNSFLNKLFTVLLFALSLPLFEILTLASVGHSLSIPSVYSFVLILGIIVLNSFFMLIIVANSRMKVIYLNIYNLLINFIFFTTFLQMLGVIIFCIFPLEIWQIILNGTYFDTFVLGVILIPLYFVYTSLLINVFFFFEKE